MWNTNCYNSNTWQSNFYDQYMQQHAAMTQWIQHLHQNMDVQDPSNSSCNYAGNQYEPYHPVDADYDRRDSYQPNQSSHRLRESPVSSSTVSYPEYEEQDLDSDEVSENESQCEYEFNVDAILAMRAAKEEMSKTSTESEGSFVVIEADKEEFEYIELGSLKHLEYTRATSVGHRNMSSELNTERKIMEEIYGKKSATIAGLETALAINFERLYDKHQPPLWPVLPVRL